jgi:hypothetical protein
MTEVTLQYIFNIKEERTDLKRMIEAKQILDVLQKQRMKDHDNDIEYTFKKIQKIDNIKVQVTLLGSHIMLKSGSYEKIQYVIKALGIHQDGYDDYDYSEYVLYMSNWYNNGQELGISLVKNILDVLHSQIALMRLDKTFGEFMTEKCEEDFDDYIDGDDCCVCYHKTVTKTDCSHHLCIACWSSMLKNDISKCPLCNSESIYVYTESEYERYGETEE